MRCRLDALAVSPVLARPRFNRREAMGLGLALAVATPALADTPDVYEGYAASMYGELKYPANFTHFDYTNPGAPKGGHVKRWAMGTYDSLNSFILKGTPANGLGYLYDTLMASSMDEPFSEYGLLASTVKIPKDRAWVAFKLRPEGRWHDGKAITIEDVVWTFNTLKTKGHPYYRAYYQNVVKAEDTGDGWVKFTFDKPGNRELPLIMGQMSVLPKHYYDKHPFDQTTLDPPLGSGPYEVAAVDPGRSITYKRVHDYWGQDLPVNSGTYNFDSIRFDYYRDSSVALEAFKAHEYDFRMENNSKDWATNYVGPPFDAGLIKKQDIPNHLPTGMQGFAFNTRRPIFKDARVREALGYAFDFPWSNKNLFYGQYTRTKSYFSNSDLAATGLPSKAELALLEPYRDKLPPELFTKPYEPPTTDGSGNIRPNLRKAMALLREAGWGVKNGMLTGPDGLKMRFEILLVQPAFERVMQPFVANLARLGVRATVRTVDASQYQNRVDDFAFDMIVDVWGESLSPGNEQRDFWGSAAADTKGSRNTVGIKNPVVDAMITKVIYAKDRASLVTAARALDRVLLWHHYVIPNWHLTYFRVAYWDKFSRPKVEPPYGLPFDAWWVDPAKAKKLKAEEKALSQ